MKAIYLKEMRSYFHSLAAFIYFALFLALWRNVLYLCSVFQYERAVKDTKKG